MTVSRARLRRLSHTSHPRHFPELNHFPPPPQPPACSATPSPPGADISFPAGLPSCPGLLLCGLHTQPGGAFQNIQQTSKDFSITCPPPPPSPLQPPLLLDLHPHPSSHTGLLAPPRPPQPPITPLPQHPSPESTALSLLPLRSSLKCHLPRPTLTTRFFSFLAHLTTHWVLHLSTR